jgi:hypothetical protein
VVGIDRITTVLKRESMFKINHLNEPFAHLWFIGIIRVSRTKALVAHSWRELIQEGEGKEFAKFIMRRGHQRNIPSYEEFWFEILKSLELKYTLYQFRRVTK